MQVKEEGKQISPYERLQTDNCSACYFQIQRICVPCISRDHVAFKILSLKPAS